jgi:hypothetical protein
LGYWLVASHGEQHVRTIYQQRGLKCTGSQIAMASGQQVRDLRVTMVPTGRISGRVIDTNGSHVECRRTGRSWAITVEGCRRQRDVPAWMYSSGFGGLPC